jgi:hypothetical protein
MSNHFSQEQFAKYIVGQSAKAELQHLSECPQCSAELEQFNNTLSEFRTIVRDRIDDRIASHPLMPALKPARASIAFFNLAWIGAVVAALVLPLFISEPKPRKPVVQPAVVETSGDISPDAVMQRVNLHLSRTLPAPMEPMMDLIPSDEPVTKSGGVK